MREYFTHFLVPVVLFLVSLPRVVMGCKSDPFTRYVVELHK